MVESLLKTLSERLFSFLYHFWWSRNRRTESDGTSQHSASYCERLFPRVAGLASAVSHPKPRTRSPI